MTRRPVYLFCFLFPPFFSAVCQVGSSLPNQGLNPYTLHWKHRVLTTGLPGQSWKWFIWLSFCYSKKITRNILVDKHRKTWSFQSLLRQNWYLCLTIWLQDGELSRLLEPQYSSSWCASLAGCGQPFFCPKNAFVWMTSLDRVATEVKARDSAAWLSGAGITGVFMWERMSRVAFALWNS